MSWERKTSKKIYENKFISLFDEEVKAPTGIKVNYGRVSFKRLAASVLIFKEDKILLVGQHRYPNNFYSWETIQGGGELTDDPETIAKKELKEEAKLEAIKLIKICETTTSNSVTDELAHLYFCDLDNATFSNERNPDDTEELQLKWFGIDEAIDLIHSNTIKDSLTQISIFFFKNKLFCSN